MCRVEPYIPNPLRCFQCQSYGHGKDRCRQDAVCARCGSNEHSDDRTCNLPEYCVNCKGSHPTYSRNCPKFKIEKEVVRIKFTQKITFPEARKLVESKEPTYANILTKQRESKKSYVTTGTQTELTWQESNKSFENINASKATAEASTCTFPPSRSSATCTSLLSTSTPTSGDLHKVNPSKKHTTQNSPKNKPTTAMKQLPQTQRQRKGSLDPITLHNKFDDLEDMDTCLPLDNKHSQRSRSPKSRSPVRPPRNKNK